MQHFKINYLSLCVIFFVVCLFQLIECYSQHWFLISPTSALLCWSWTPGIIGITNLVQLGILWLDELDRRGDNVTISTSSKRRTLCVYWKKKKSNARHSMNGGSGKRATPFCDQCAEGKPYAQNPSRTQKICGSSRNYYSDFQIPQWPIWF